MIKSSRRYFSGLSHALSHLDFSHLIPHVRFSNSLSREQASHAHTCSNTHRNHTKLLVLTLQLWHQSGQLPCPSHSQRVPWINYQSGSRRWNSERGRLTKRDRTTLWVHFCLINPKFPDTVQRLACKRFVDLPNANILNVDARVL
jgi:hypothetical protein